MAEPLYQMNLDPESISRINAMLMAETRFGSYYQAAMNACVNYVNRKAQENAPVLTGTLRRGIRGLTLSPVLGVVGVVNSVPYGRRRELGFDNQTDAIGRRYTMDPLPDTVSSDGALARSHMFYLRRALVDSQPFIRQAFSTTTALFVRDIGTGLMGGLANDALGGLP